VPRTKSTAKPAPKVFRIAGGRMTAEVKNPVAEPPTPAVTPTPERIRELAHHKWEAAGWPASDGVAFWLEAERELTGK
jgi:hypothetical protein